MKEKLAPRARFELSTLRLTAVNLISSQVAGAELNRGKSASSDQIGLLITLACCLVHWRPQSAATCGSSPATSSSTGSLRRDLVRILRGVYFRFLHFPPLCQNR